MTNYLIDQAGVGTSPGIAFGPSGEGYVRFAFTLDPQDADGFDRSDARPFQMTQ